MKNKLIRHVKWGNRNPYDLSSLSWACGRCGGLIKPKGPYQAYMPNTRYCYCTKHKNKAD